MGGGPSSQQVNAANSSAALSNAMASGYNQMFPIVTSRLQQTTPFYSGMMNRGLPYFNQLTDAAGGTTARAFAPQKAQLERSMGQQANMLPSGFAQQARTDLGSQQGRAFDQQLQNALGQNFATQQAGAAGLMGQAQVANPLGYGAAANQGFQGIMGAPLASPGLGGLLGGMAGGLMSAFPF